MKIRESFVTNSSSSSYIIAKKKDISDDELEKSIRETYLKNKNSFLKFLEEYIGDYDDPETVVDSSYAGEGKLLKAYMEKDDEKIDKEYIHFLKTKMEELFLDEWTGIGTLDSWKATIFEASNEDEDFFSSLMYHLPNLIKNEYIKVI